MSRKKYFANNIFGNYVSSKSSSMVELHNMMNNIVLAQKTINPEEKSNYYYQAGLSGLLFISNMTDTIVSTPKVSRLTNTLNNSTVVFRLNENVKKAISLHEEGKVDINLFQSILADFYTVLGGGSAYKNSGLIRGWGLPLSFAGDLIAEIAIATGPREVISTEEFYNLENWKGFAGELLENCSRWFYGWLPDGLNPWKDLNRDGKVHIYDPIIMDFGGEGFVTTAANGFSGMLFDHNADGIATATGWIGKNNGLLVRDLNGNGVIDSGRELLGDNAFLADGTLAAHGYQLLAELDENGDGKLDMQDSSFVSLKVLMDINQDDMVEVHELLSLSDLGVVSIDLNYQEISASLGGGNFLTHSGRFIRDDGSEGEMGNVAFAVDRLYSRYTDNVVLTDEQLQAPNLKGMGRLRDLREAAALSPKLAGFLKAYAEADVKEEQMALLSDLITFWSDTDPQKSALSDFVLSQDLVLTEHSGFGLTPTQAAQWRRGEALPEFIQEAFLEVRHKIFVLDAFTGEHSERLYVGTVSQAQDLLKMIDTSYAYLERAVYQGLLLQTRLRPYLAEIEVSLNKDGFFTFDYQSIKEKFEDVFYVNPQKAFVDLGEFLAFSGFEDWIEGRELLAEFVREGKEMNVLNDWLLVLGEHASVILSEQNGSEADDVLKAVGLLGRDVLHGNGGDDVLLIGNAYALADGGEGSDVYVFNKGFGETTIYNHDLSVERYDVIRLSAFDKDDVSYVRVGNDLLISVSGELNRITVKDMFLGDVLSRHIDAIECRDGVIALAEIKAHLLQGTAGDDYLQGYGEDDVIYAGAGNDKIYSYNGNDLIYAGMGDDFIDAGAGHDVVYLESGNNRVYGGDGDDRLVSGIGHDFLEGGMGSDVYIFGKMFGRDIVLNFNPNQGDKDVLQFQATVLSDVVIQRQALDLLIRQKDGQEVVVQNFFEQDGRGSYTVQYVEFADGNQLSTEQLRQWVVSPTQGDDVIYAYSEGGVMYGGDGNDRLIGNQGVDYLVGGRGNDVLIGGKGNDRLEGGIGNDIYLFNLGDGNDRIYDSFGKDTIKFGKGIRQEDLQFSRSGRDMKIEIFGGNDSVTVEGWFNFIGRKIEVIELEDGTKFNAEVVEKLAQASERIAGLNPVTASAQDYLMVNQLEVY